MIKIKSLDIIVANRKEAKDILGGTNAYNKALKEDNLIFINTNIANNGVYERTNQNNF